MAGRVVAEAVGEARLDLTRFNADLARMKKSLESIGKTTIDIDIDAGAALSRIKSVKSALSGIDANVDVDLDTAAAVSRIEALGKLKPTIEANVDVDATSALAKLEAYKVGLKASVGALQIEGLTNRLKSLNPTIEVGTKFDAAAAVSKIEALSRLRPTIEVDVDISNKERILLGLRSLSDRAKGLFNFDGIGSKLSSSIGSSLKLDGVEGKLSGLASLFRLSTQQGLQFSGSLASISAAAGPAGLAIIGLTAVLGAGALAFAGISAGAIAAGAAITTFAIDAAAELQLPLAAFSRITKQDFGALFKDISIFAEKTPFTLADSISSATRLIAQGIPKTRVVGDLSAIADAVALAGGTTTNFNNVILALSKSLGRGVFQQRDLTAILRNVPIVSQAGILKQIIADSNGALKTTTDVVKAMRAGTVDSKLAYESILKYFKSIEGASGAAVLGSKTLQGALTNVKDLAQTISIVGFGSFLKDAVDVLASPDFSGSIAKAFLDIGKSVKDVFDQIRPAIIPFIQQFGQFISGTLSGLAPVFGEVARQVTFFFQQWNSFTRGFAGSAVFDSILSAVKELGRWIPLVVRSIVYMTAAFATLVNIGSKVTATILNIGVTLVEVLAKAGIKAVQLVTSIINKMIDRYNTLAAIFNEVLPEQIELPQIGRLNFDDFLNGVYDTVDSVADKVRGSFESIDITTGISEALKLSPEELSKLRSESLPKIISEVFGNQTDSVQQGLGELKDSIIGGYGEVSDAAEEAIGGLIDDVSAVYERDLKSFNDRFATEFNPGELIASSFKTLNESGLSKFSIEVDSNLDAVLGQANAVREALSQGLPFLAESLSKADPKEALASWEKLKGTAESVNIERQIQDVVTFKAVIETATQSFVGMQNAVNEIAISGLFSNVPKLLGVFRSTISSLSGEIAKVQTLQITPNVNEKALQASLDRVSDLSRKSIDLLKFQLAIKEPSKKELEAARDFLIRQVDTLGSIGLTADVKIAEDALTDIYAKLDQVKPTAVQVPVEPKIEGGGLFDSIFGGDGVPTQTVNVDVAGSDEIATTKAQIDAIPESKQFNLNVVENGSIAAIFVLINAIPTQKQVQIVLNDSGTIATTFAAISAIPSLVVVPVLVTDAGSTAAVLAGIAALPKFVLVTVLVTDLGSTAIVLFKLLALPRRIVIPVFVSDFGTILILRALLNTIPTRISVGVGVYLDQSYGRVRSALDELSRNRSSTITVYRNVVTNDPLAGTLPGRRTGGKTFANRSYMVGEGGPEIITPSRDMYVLNNATTQRIQAVLGAQTNGRSPSSGVRSHGPATASPGTFTIDTGTAVKIGETIAANMPPPVLVQRPDANPEAIVSTYMARMRLRRMPSEAP